MCTGMAQDGVQQVHFTLFTSCWACFTSNKVMIIRPGCCLLRSFLFFLIYFIIFKRTFFPWEILLFEWWIRFTKQCTGSLHLSIMSSVPSVQPLDSHMHLEAKTHIIWKRLPTKPPSHLSAPCRCLLSWCLSAQDPLMHTGMEGLDTVHSSGVKLWT